MKAMMTAMMTAAIKRCLFIFLPSACRWSFGLSSGLSGAPRWSGIWEEGDSALRGQGARWRTPPCSPRASKGRGSRSWGGPRSVGPSVGLPGGGPPFLGSFTAPWGLCSQSFGPLCAPHPGGPDRARVCGGGDSLQSLQECPALNTQGSSPRPAVLGGGAPAGEAAAPHVLARGPCTTSHSAAGGAGPTRGPAGSGARGRGVGEWGRRLLRPGSPRQRQRQRRVADGDRPRDDANRLPGRAGHGGNPREQPGLAPGQETAPPAGPKGLGGGQQGAPAALCTPQGRLRPSEGRPVHLIVLETPAWAIYRHGQSWKAGGKRSLGARRALLVTQVWPGPHLAPGSPCASAAEGDGVQTVQTQSM